MGPPSYMRSVVDRNVVMRRIPVCPSPHCIQIGCITRPVSREGRNGVLSAWVRRTGREVDYCRVFNTEEEQCVSVFHTFL